MTRVLVVAPSPLARAGIQSLLAGAASLEVIGSVPAWSDYSGPEPDVIVADADSAEELSIELSEAAPLVLLTADVPQSGVAEALRSGARAVLPNQAGASQIIAAIEAAAAGLVVLQAADLDGLLLAPRQATLAEPLTPREIEVLALLAEGQSNKSIAHRLGISEHTVKFHVASILGKLHAGSRTEAVTLGIRQGLIML